MTKRALPSSFSMLRHLLAREWMVERRTLGWVSSGALLGLQLIVVLGLGFSGSLAGETKTELTFVGLWLVLFFAGTVGVGRSFSSEREGDAIGGLLLLPIPKGVLYLSKVLSGLAFLWCASLVVLAASVVFLDMEGAMIVKAAPVILLAGLGYVATATTVAAMTSGMRSGDAMLAIALFPLLVPLFLAALKATQTIALGGTLSETTDQLILLASVDLVYLAIGFFAFEGVLSA